MSITQFIVYHSSTLDHTRHTTKYQE